MTRVQVDPAELGARIHNARRRAGYSLEMVALHTGVHHSQLSRIERGAFRHYGRNVQKLCEFFALSPTPDELETLRARLERAVLTSPTRKALEAVLDAIDAGQSRVRGGRWQ